MKPAQPAPNTSDAYIATFPTEVQAMLEQIWMMIHEARLIRSPNIVRVVVEQLRRDETVFLHPISVDEQCDEARASLLSCQQ